MMNLIDAFLLVSGIAYLAAAVFPKPLLKHPKMHPAYEVAIFGTLGITIIVNLMTSSYNVWVLLGIIETIACGMTFLGHQQWNVLWKTEASDAAQLAMWVWDLAIAVCCFMKVPFTF